MSSKVSLLTLPYLRKEVNTCLSCKIRQMSTTMKAVQIRSTGDTSVLKVETVPVPNIKSNEVLVKIHAAGLNPVDTYMRGKQFGYDPKLPAILGLEAAGEISKIGENAGSKYKVGDRVICCLHGNQLGGYAEFAACDVDSLVPLSDKLTFSQGAAVYVPYFTAYKALISRCKLKPKELILINGASGAVGLAALQISKAFVAGLCLEERCDVAAAASDRYDGPDQTHLKLRFPRTRNRYESGLMLFAEKLLLQAGREGGLLERATVDFHPP